MKDQRKKPPAASAPQVDELRAQLNALLEKGAVLTEREKILMDALVRLSGDPSAATTPQAEPPAPKQSLRDRVREALIERSMDIHRLGTHLKLRDRQPLRVLIEKLRTEGVIYNLSNEDNPVWTWRVGADADAQLLHRVILKLLKERPMEREDLVRATGANEKQVDGRLVEIRRSENVIDLAPGGTYPQAYFVLSGEARDAKLAPKKTPKQTTIVHGARRDRHGH